MDVRAPRAARLLAALVLILLAAAAPAGAQQPQPVPALDSRPAFHSLTGREAIRIASRDAKVREERARGGRLTPFAYLSGSDRWQISFFRAGRERAQVLVDDARGSVVESWTGWQVPWKMARGYSGQFGGKLNAPYVWLPLCLLFLLPFVDPRRPFRMVHLDLLALLAFGASHFFFNRGEISVSVPLVYPVLLYLLGRMLWVGLRGARTPDPSRRLVPRVPIAWLALALVLLVGFRVALNVTESTVIDVGYSGVAGAHRIVTGHGLYDRRFPHDDPRGDTYGPVGYLLYVPFERALGFSGHWDDLPAAHAAAIAFDLLTLLGLLVLGRRLRAGPEGTALGVALAYAWAAYPYSLFALQSNSNDAAVAMLLVWALVALRSPAGRGALAALAAAVKLAPVALAPLLAAGTERSRGRTLVFAAVFAAVVVAAFAPFVPHGGVRAIWDRTIGYQAGRDSPFSLWGQHHSLEWLHAAVTVAAAGLALLVAFVPRRRSPAQVAALGAAVLIAVQLAAAHWFYLYLAWFAPLVLVAVLAPLRAVAVVPERREEPDAQPVPVAATSPEGGRTAPEPAPA